MVDGPNALAVVLVNSSFVPLRTTWMSTEPLWSIARGYGRAYGEGVGAEDAHPSTDPHTAHAAQSPIVIRRIGERLERMPL